MIFSHFNMCTLHVFFFLFAANSAALPANCKITAIEIHDSSIIIMSAMVTFQTAQSPSVSDGYVAQSPSVSDGYVAQSPSVSDGYVAQSPSVWRVRVRPSDPSPFNLDDSAGSLTH